METALATTTPAACSAGAPNDNGFNVLTGTALATAINVAAGQVMTVTISFS